jgi:hypothetical protein
MRYEPLSQPVGKVMGDRETLHVLNHPGRYSLSVGQVLRRIAAIRADGLPIDVVETTEGGLHRPEYDVAAIGLPRVATDDSHRDEDFGRVWIEVEAARTADSILRAVKAGDFGLGFAP